MDFGEDDILEEKKEEEQHGEEPLEATPTHAAAGSIPISDQHILISDPTEEEREVRFPRLRSHVDQGEIIGSPHDGVRTRSFSQNYMNHVAFISHIEPKNVEEALLDAYWIIAMQDELNQCKTRNFESGAFW